MADFGGEDGSGSSAAGDPVPAPPDLVGAAERLLSDRTAAAADATKALERARATGQDELTPTASAVLAIVEAAEGRTESCRRRCFALLDAPDASPLVRAAALWALGHLELGQGRPGPAARWFEILAGSGPDVRGVGATATMWGPDLAEAYVRLGRPERARSVVEDLGNRVMDSAGPRALAAVARCRAMLATDDREAEALFASALRHLGGPEGRFGRARTELARGIRLRRAGRAADARRRLDNAHALFVQLGAQGWARQARTELDLLGVPGPQDGAVDLADLSSDELQVATAAALGGRAADMAAAMFVDEATVGTQLGAAVQKLGVSGLDELQGLAGRLAHAWTSRPPAGSYDRAFRDDAGISGSGPAWTVRLLGGFEIRAGGAPVVPPQGVTAQAVKRVALAGRLPAEELTELLWPGAPPDNGRGRLRSLLARLRQSSGPVLVRDGDWVALADGTEVDVPRFVECAIAAQAAASSGEVHAGTIAREALALYRGELLPADRHLDFTAGPREGLRRRYLALLSIAVDDAASRAQVELAVHLLEDAIATEPHDEGLYLRTASLLHGSGRASEARAVLRRARAMLAELELPPSPAVTALERSLAG